MDPLFMANSLFRRRRLDECVKVCTELLEKNPRDQVFVCYMLKYCDGIDVIHRRRGV